MTVSGPGVADRRIVGTYADYPEAERAVDYLSDQGFPVERMTIVGRDVEMVEQITGRLTSLSAAGRGAVSGAVTGALLGWLFGLFNWLSPLISVLLLAVYGLVFGAIVGALIGLLAHAATGGNRDFSSQHGFQAGSYDLLVDTEVADEAIRLLRTYGAPDTSGVAIA